MANAMGQIAEQGEAVWRSLGNYLCRPAERAVAEGQCAGRI